MAVDIPRTAPWQARPVKRVYPVSDVANLDRVVGVVRGGRHYWVFDFARDGGGHAVVRAADRYRVDRSTVVTCAG